MRTKIIATVMISALSSGSAFAVDNSESAPTVEKILQSAKVSCNPGEYKNPDGNDKPGLSLAACQACQKALPQIAKGVKGTFQSAVASDGAANAGTGAALGAIQGASEARQDQKQIDASKSQAAGNKGMNQKANNSKAISQAGQNCAEDIKNQCQDGQQLAGEDQNNVKQAKNACEQLQKEGAANAAENAGKGMDMGQLGQMAQQLAQGLGSMMKGKEGGGDKGGATADPYQSSLSDPYSSASTTSATEVTPNASNIATPDSSKSLARATNGALFDGVNAASNSSPIGAIGANGAATDGVHANAGSNTPGGNGMEHYGPDTAYTAGTNGGSGGGGSPSMAGGMGGSFGGGGSGDTSGASQFDPNAKNAAGAGGAGASGDGNYEISQGGGGRSFIGLKSKSAELGDLDGALGGEGGSGGLDLASLGEEEGRDLASEGGEMAADIHADDGSSLFNVIRTKLVEIKKRGNI